MFEVRKALAIKALELVHTSGWESALNQASSDLNYSPVPEIQAIISQLFPNGAYDLIHTLMQQWKEQLYIDFKPYPELSHYSLYTVTRKRLEYMLQYSALWPEAMRIGARPAHILSTTNALWTTFDAIYALSGEQQYDVLYPLKRTSLALMFVATEVELVRNPEKAEETFGNMETRIIRSFQGGMIAENMLEVAKFVGKANYRVLQSLYPEPREHKNPIVK
jgi:rpsU-divergently transcribed protein